MNWKTFIKAGRALFTVENLKSGNRFTFKVNKHKSKDVWFVYVLTGPDNCQDYKFVGVIDETTFILTPRCKATPSWEAFNWLNGMLNTDKSLPDYIRIFHCGRCGRCGRLLTVPESIETGFGPECQSILGITPKGFHDLLDVDSIRKKIAELEMEIENGHQNIKGISKE